MPRRVPFIWQHVGAQWCAFHDVHEAKASHTPCLAMGLACVKRQSLAPLMFSVPEIIMFTKPKNAFALGMESELVLRPTHC